MALQWDMLATADTKVMLAAQQEILQKPYGTSWITYTRCHDDIGLGYDDAMIRHAGYEAYAHRSFLKDYYSGNHPFSSARGALFSSNPKTGDARISGSLASLCGLEVALENNNSLAIHTAVNKILLMQAHSFFLGGIPMIFYGDEAGYTNDYSYLQDPSKSYDNRWMHRPIINWEKNENIHQKGSIENIVFEGTQKLIAIRNKIPAFADIKNLIWLTPHNHRIAGYLRHTKESNVFCVFNFSNEYTDLTWYAFKEKHLRPSQLFDHWSGNTFNIGNDHEYMTLAPYQFCVLEVIV
jgi:amylosucrase